MADNKSGQPSARKTTKRVTANKNIFAGANSQSSTKTTARKAGAAVTGAAVAVGAARTMKKMSGKSIAVIFICFILALAIGVGVCFFLGRNDKFDMLGAEQIYLSVNDKYTDEGVEIKEFGINLSKKAIVDTDLKTDENGNYYADSAGDYYIAYTVKSLKFGLIYPVQKIRLISVIGESEGGE